MPSLRSPALVLLGLAALAATSGLVRSALPLPEALGLRQKMEHFRGIEDDYDLLYVGSSFLLRSLIPRVIDEELSLAGHEVRSYNLGIPAMTSLETDHVLRELVARRPARLRWVVLEPDQWFALGPNDANIVTQRTTGWHSVRQTRNVLGVLWRESVPTGKKLGQTWGHLGLMARHLTAYGRGPELAAVLLGGTPELTPFTAEELSSGGGFQALDGVLDQQGRRELFRRQGEDWDQRIAALAAQPPANELPPRDVVRQHFPRRFPVACVEEQVDFLRSHGVEPLYVSPPATLPSPPARLLARGGYIPSLLTFNDPKRHPQLYVREHFFDLNHLNEAGAEAFSRLFARELAAQLSGGADGSVP